ncbi:MAG TPA: MFS transporter [Methylophilaceae bacterium]|nr:MFS transporter [Methylophilaceae bacterium]
MTQTERMSKLELRASMSLASIYGLRMLGMFLILPIFSIYGETLPGGENHLLIGLALGAYGLTQAMFQLPFGMASDRYGRKRMIYIGLIVFAIGSFIAGFADDLYTIILGRAIQGAGAVSAAVTALTADLTREEHRTKAMAIIGGTIGITFALSLVLGPTLNRWIGVPGIFLMTGILAALAIFVVKFVVPDPKASHFHSDAEASTGRLKEVLRNAQLLRLNYGIFALHAAQMAMFVVVPFAIKQSSGMSENDHWQVYLPVMVASFAIMLPAIIYGEKQGKVKPVFVSAIAIMLGAQLLFAGTIQHFWGIVGSLTAYFVAFNLLEANLPSIISRVAPAAAKGTAIGVYNTAQSLGIFIGGAAGGFLSHYYGFASVFIFCGALMALWLLLAISMAPPPAIRNKMYRIGNMDPTQARELQAQLSTLQGVREVVVLPDEGVAILKVDMRQAWDEAGAHLLLKQDGKSAPVPFAAA